MGARDEQAVHLGHLHVHEYQIERSAFHQVQSLPAVGRRGNFVALCVNRATSSFWFTFVIVRQQDVQRSAHIGRGQIGQNRSSRIGAQRGRPGGATSAADRAGMPSTTVTWKVLPLPTSTLQPDLAPHQLGEPGNDRQAEAGAAVLAGELFVRLLKWAKNRHLLVDRNADACVGHGYL